MYRLYQDKLCFGEYFSSEKRPVYHLFKIIPHDGPFPKLTPEEVWVISTFQINAECSHLFVLSKILNPLQKEEDEKGERSVGAP